MPKFWSATRQRWEPPLPVASPAPPVVIPVLASAPLLIGSAKVGRTFTVDEGAWTSAEPVTYTYQWYRKALPSGVESAIANANSRTYTTQAGDDAGGAKVRCQVVASNSAGSSTPATTPLSARLWPAFLVGVGGVNEAGQADDFTTTIPGYPGYGSFRSRWRATYEQWLGKRVNLFRQFATTDSFGAGDVQWDFTQPSCIIDDALARLRAWKTHGGQWAAGQLIDPQDASQGTWTADPAGTVRKVMFVVSPGFSWVATDAPLPGGPSDWFTSGNVPAADAYNSAVRLMSQKAWRWIAYGDPTATTQVDSDGSPTNQPYHCWTGTVDNYADKMCRALFNYSLSDSIIQLWHESAGGWYTWEWVDPAAYIAAWRRFVTKYRATEASLGLNPASAALFAWPYDFLDGVASNQQHIYARLTTSDTMIRPESCYPGDDYVDLLGPDLYISSADGGADTLARMTAAKSFSDAHGGKLLVNCEWSVRGSGATVPDTGAGSMTAGVDAMHTKLLADDWYSACYFDTTAPGLNFQLAPSAPPGTASPYPTGASEYESLFGVPPVVGDPTPTVPVDGKTFVVSINDTSPTPVAGFQKSHNRIQSNASNANPTTPESANHGGAMPAGDAAALATLGVNLERVFFHLNFAFPTQGTYNTGTHTGTPNTDYLNYSNLSRIGASDSTLADLASRGVEPVICFDRKPSWVAPLDNSLVTPQITSLNPPSDNTTYRDLLILAMRHIKTRTNSWKYAEFWNEPDGSTGWQGTPSNSFGLYDAFSDAVTQVNTDITNGANGMSSAWPLIQLAGPVTAQPDYQWVDQFLSHVQTGNKKLDILSHHLYPTTDISPREPIGYYDAAVSMRALLMQAFSVAVNATGGTWTLTLLGHTTAALAFNITAATLKSTLEALLGKTAANPITVSRQPITGGANNTVLNYHVTFATVAENTGVGTVTTSAAGLTGGAHSTTVRTTAGYAGRYVDANGQPLLPLWVTEYASAAVNGLNGTPNGTKPPSLTAVNLAQEAAWWLAASFQAARGGVAKMFGFSESDYQNYTRSIIAPYPFVGGSWNPNAPAGTLYPRGHAARLLALMPTAGVGATGVGASVATIADGHGFGVIASASTAGGVGSHGQVGVLVWYHRKPALNENGPAGAQPNVAPNLQVNNLPAGLRNRSLVAHRYVVDEHWSNWEANQATASLQQATDLTGLGPFAVHATGIGLGVTWDSTSPSTLPGGYGEYKIVLFIIEAASA